MTKMIEMLRGEPRASKGMRLAVPDHVAAAAVADGRARIVPSVFDKVAPPPAQSPLLTRPALVAPLYSTRVRVARKPR
jgi:hypothetical protein